MRTEWDHAKAAANFIKHRVPFEEAATVFDDTLSETYRDDAHSVEETRYVTVGCSRAGRILVVAHADRGPAVRLISARRATRGERRFYEEGIQAARRRHPS